MIITAILAYESQNDVECDTLRLVTSDGRMYRIIERENELSLIALGGRLHLSPRSANAVDIITEGEEYIDGKS